ncbi:MAG: hypothetical protein ABI685_01050 [Ferruginibacter sp.]
MKNYTTTHNSLVFALLKFFSRALKSVFESTDNREFKRLKDFISS